MRFWAAVTDGDWFRDSDVDSGRELWDRVAPFAQSSGAPLAVAERPAVADRYGTPFLIAPRLGQGAFRLAVADAYERRCAITGERTLPVLDAAHIRPYEADGPHAVPNGLLLRKDLHALFDRGYVTVTPGMKVRVSGRIRERYLNGRDYYALDGHELRVPREPELHPALEYLEWHGDTIFLG